MVGFQAFLIRLVEVISSAFLDLPIVDEHSPGRDLVRARLHEAFSVGRDVAFEDLRAGTGLSREAVAEILVSEAVAGQKIGILLSPAGAQVRIERPGPALVTDGAALAA